MGVQGGKGAVLEFELRALCLLGRNLSQYTSPSVVVLNPISSFLSVLLLRLPAKSKSIETREYSECMLIQERDELLNCVCPETVNGMNQFY
jgi:hypothetical protein